MSLLTVVAFLFLKTQTKPKTTNTQTKQKCAHFIFLCFKIHPAEVDAGETCGTVGNAVYVTCCIEMVGTYLSQRMLPPVFPVPQCSLSHSLPIQKHAHLSWLFFFSVVLGHLHVKGSQEKMSKSLKNYVTIKVISFCELKQCMFVLHEY